MNLAERAGVDAARYVIPQCPMVETPRGGLHLWFGYPPGEFYIGNRINVLKGIAEQIDVRGNDGYVIIPPSVRRGARATDEGCEGKAYAWRHGGTIADIPPLLPAPPEIVRLVTEKRRSLGETGRASGSLATKPVPLRVSTAPDPRERAIENFVAAALDGELRKVAGERRGSRNTTLNNAALSLGHHVGSGRLSEDLVHRLLFDAAVQSGLVEEDGAQSALATIGSGLRAGIADPAIYENVGQLVGGTRPPPIARAHDYVSAASKPRSPFEAGKPGGHNSPENSDFCDWEGRDEDAGSAEHPLDGGGMNTPPPGPPSGRGNDGSKDLDPTKLERASSLEQNDTGNAERMRLWFGEEFLNVEVADSPTSGLGLHHWTGTHWEQTDANRRVQKFAQETARRTQFEVRFLKMTKAEQAAHDRAQALFRKPPQERSNEENIAIVEGKRAKAALEARKAARHKFAISSGNGPRLGHMIQQALPHCTHQPAEMDADPVLINCRNGTIAIARDHDPECPDPHCDGACGRTVPRFVLKPHAREDLISKIMPVDYDPKATAPRFLKFVERCQPKEEIRNYLRCWHGLGLTGLTEQAFVLNYGVGANGKTTFIETIARLQGSYARTLPAEALVGDQQRRGDQATPELARLASARLVRAAELPRGQSFRESTIKLLTGGEPMPVRHLHGRFWDLTPVFKAVSTCNEKPNITGVDEGIWRRVKLVPWEYAIPVHERRKIEDVLAEFDEERSGILNWLLEGLLEYMINGLSVPQAIVEATESYRDEMDPVGSFVEGCVTHSEEQSGKSVGARELFDAYVAYSKANSLRAYTAKNFANIMGNKGFKKKRKAGGIRYLDIELHDVPEDSDRMRSIGYISRAMG